MTICTGDGHEEEFVKDSGRESHGSDVANNKEGDLPVFMENSEDSDESKNGVERNLRIGECP
jgi:hypothetical protein